MTLVCFNCGSENLSVPKAEIKMFKTMIESVGLKMKEPKHYRRCEDCGAMGEAKER